MPLVIEAQSFLSSSACDALNSDVAGIEPAQIRVLPAQNDVLPAHVLVPPPQVCRAPPPGLPRAIPDQLSAAPGLPRAAQVCRAPSQIASGCPVLGSIS